jgi:ligand-binding sensor domain-containing protein
MLLHSKEGEIVIKGEEKLYSINKYGKITPIKLSSKFQSLVLAEDFITFHSLETDKDARLWVGTEKGLFIIDNRNNEYFYFGNNASSNPTFKHTAINQIYRDRDDKMWVSTPDGLYLWNETEKNLRSVNFTSENTTNIQTNFVNLVYQDQQKKIWVGSQKGLYLFNEKTEASNIYNGNAGLANDNVRNITEDNEGNLWLLTDIGLSQFNPSTINFQNYDHQDGLSDSRSYMRIIKKSDGTLYFASREGLHFLILSH